MRQPDPAVLPAKAKTAVTACSYNIRKAIGADRRRRPERILEVIAEMQPDIAVIQEADRRFGERQAALPRDLLAAYGWQAIDFSVRSGSIGWHGNAILVSSRVEVVARHRLVLPTLEPRGAVAADLLIDNRPLRIVGMHLDLSGLWRRRQARTIVDALAHYQPDVPTVMMGDMNEWRNAAGCIADFAASYKLVHTGPSFPARMPMGRLDRIFVSNALEVTGAGVHRSAQAAQASDHLPLWVQVQT